MADRKYTHGLSVRTECGTTVVNIGDMEIWDGADLSLLRDTLSTLIHRDRCRAVGIDMAAVKFVPSGYFGMLFDWFEQGVAVRVLAPQPRVQNMLWFRRFFDWERDECFRLRDSAPFSEQQADEWSLVKPWQSSEDGDRDMAVARMH